jgi:hypothetical protein
VEEWYAKQGRCLLCKERCQPPRRIMNMTV